MAKPDFSKIFAQNGSVIPLTDSQFLQGFDYLQDNPPTKEEFNWLLQQISIKLQYLNENSGLNLWQPEHTYAVGDVCYSRNATSYKFMECIQAGTTAAVEPAWPSVGQEVADGTCKWRVRDIKSGGGVPIGSIMPFLAKTPQPGWLACDTGAMVSRDTYKELWAWVQQNAPLISESEWQTQAAVQSSVGYYSSGDGSTTFRLPRIVDFVRGSDANRAAGTYQADQMQGHRHAIREASGATGITNSDSVAGANVPTADRNSSPPILDPIPDGVNGTPRTGSETRPKSISMIYCVKAFDAVTNQGLIDITALANSVAGKVNLTDFIGANQSLSSNGWQKLPGGLIIQWAQGVNAVAAGHQTITFPIAFPTAVLKVFVTTLILGTSPSHAIYQLSTNSAGSLTQCQVYRNPIGTEDGLGVTPYILVIGC